jgi:mycothiol synthase
MDEIELRPAGIGEMAAIAALVRRAEAHDGVPRLLLDEELVNDWGASHLELDADTRVAVRNGELVGYAYVWNPPAQHRLERAELVGEVAPEHRATGVGRALLAWSVARARERLTSRTHDLARFIRVGAFDWLDDRHRLYRRLGFDAVRWNDELGRPLLDLPPMRVPAGVTLLPWPADRDDEIRMMRNAAFADHWGSTVVEAEQWHEFVRGYGARPDLSVVAVDESTGEVVGMCANHIYAEDEAVTGRREAWIANVATLRAARGRGVGSAMIAWSLATFADAGFSHAMLDVDTENPTGAARLYRNLGFEAHRRSITYEIELGADRDPRHVARTPPREARDLEPRRAHLPRERAGRHDAADPERGSP